ncbi:protocadherin Fat 1-like [Lineus longissimus]|uniref:protocadherin Fat 1-like n=1 Tax=Lineus longissimus TaxID=88925 RepID=UPI00315DB3B0
MLEFLREKRVHINQAEDTSLLLLISRMRGEASGVMRCVSLFCLMIVMFLPDEMDGAITFTSPAANPHTVTAPENAPPTPIATVTATTDLNDPATGVPPTKMFYTMTSAPADGKFIIDPSTGIITAAANATFDFENSALGKPTADERRYVLTVTAFSGIYDGTPLTLETADMVINYDITNVNEDIEITNLPKCLNVYENNGPETIVAVSVSDGDETPTGQRLYNFNIESKEPSEYDDFDIDKRAPATGGPLTRHESWLKTIGSLNYEKQNNYNMTISAEDEFGKTITPTPVKKTRSHKVEVQVIDVNERPKFYETSSTCEVAENTPIGTTVSTGIYPFRAFDVDKFPGPNCLGKWPESVEYFVEGKFSELFRMSNVNVTGAGHVDGYLVVNALIDREDPVNPRKGTFNLYVNARDHRGLRIADRDEVTVTCKITDVDDNPTICKDYKFEAELQENTPHDTPVLTVSCSDKDDTTTNPIIYEIKDVGIEKEATLADKYFHFGSGGTSPIMTTKARLNLEGGTTLNFTVTVRQGAAFSQMSTTLSVDITVIGKNDHRPTMDKDFYNFFVAYNEKDGFAIGKVSASDLDQPKSSITYFLVEKAEGIQLGTVSGQLFVDYTYIKAKGITAEKTLEKNQKYWMSARANDNDKPPYYSNYVYIRVNTYVKDDVMINIEVAVGIGDFSDSQLAEFEQSISNICKPCKGICPEKSAKGVNTVVTCFALTDDRTFQKTNKEQKVSFVSQDELIDYLTSEKLVAGNIYGFGTYDIVSVTKYGQGPDLLPLWIVLGILGFIGLLCGLAFAIKACISHGLCKPRPSQPKPPAKQLHPESYDVDTFNFNYAAHDKGPM